MSIEKKADFIKQFKIIAVEELEYHLPDEAPTTKMLLKAGVAIDNKITHMIRAIHQNMNN